ncbi:hypothetical protein ACVLV4_000421 [Rathayibacter agropyri]
MFNSLTFESKIMPALIAGCLAIAIGSTAISMVDSFQHEATKASSSLSQTLSNPLGSKLAR